MSQPTSAFTSASPAGVIPTERRGGLHQTPPPPRAHRIDMPAYGGHEADLEQPLVSILVAVKNEARYVRESLESLLGQTWRNIEVIVIDDNSEDATVQIVGQVMQADPRVRLLRSSGRGKVHAYNMAWSQARGDIIALFAGDDVMPEYSIACRVELLMRHGCQVASGKVRSFSDNPKYDGILYPRGDRPNLSGGATAFTRQFADTVFPIPEELPNEDVWTRLHIECFSDMVVWTDDVISRYRIHENNSMAFGAPFEVKSKVMHVRSKAYALFLERYKHRLPERSVAQLQAMLELDRKRCAGDFIGILFMRHLSMSQKLSAISYSNRFFYRLRLLLERYVAGA